MTIYTIFWAVVLVATVIAEAVTFQLVTIWFAAGAAVALVMSLLGIPFPIQAILFTASSAGLLLVTRPFIEKLKVKNVLPTNADAEVGKIAVVTESISNGKNTGRVKIGGVNWRARALSDNDEFSVGENVRVQHISGTTAYVSKE